jgi:hypothetical protein
MTRIKSLANRIMVDFNTFEIGLCDQLLQQFHRVDEELSIQGKWQGGSVTGVCRGWGTNKVSARFGDWVHHWMKCAHVKVPLYLVSIPRVNVSYRRHCSEKGSR